MMWYEKIWYSDSPLHTIFLPFSFLYKCYITVRGWLYRWKILRQHSVKVPVIVVGNITVGGTGKTPFVIALANWLKEQGERPAIVSRGYGGQSREYPVLVSGQSTADEVGDETILIWRQTSCPVMVHPQRVRAAQKLVADTDCTVIISDDGLQHTQLARDIEILLVDGQRKFGNEELLPAGPLRESMARLNKVDFIISKGQKISDEIPEAYLMQTLYGEICNLRDSTLKLTKDNTPLAFAFAGIANPKPFYDYLDQQGFNLRKHSFPDHYQFDQSDFAFTDTVPVIMTEKDAVKCENFSQSNWWYLPIKAELPSSFWEKLKERFEKVKNKKAEIVA